MKHNTPLGSFVENPEKCKLIACSAVIEELESMIPSGMELKVLEFGLHIDPKKLKKAIQEAIDESLPPIEVIILGYGLCSQAVVGLGSRTCSLVIPRADDCIALFLGSAEAYRRQNQQAPGTYYLTRGWIKGGGNPFDEFNKLEQVYGAGRARDILNQMLKNYTRIGLIDTGQYNLDGCREYARDYAQKMNLRYEEIPGSDSFLRAMLFGPWDHRFVVVPPNRNISFFDFKVEKLEKNE
jgi:hypothetical protein